MVGLKDIPCVGVALDKISEATVAAAIRGLRYMFCHKRFLNDLNSEIGKIKIEEGEFARRIDEAKDDGKIIEDYVAEWQGKVENVKNQAAELTGQTTSTTCFKVVHLPNPVSRFRVGRKAARLAETVIEHTNFGKELLDNEIAHYAPDDNLPNSDTSYQTFASRQEAYEKLLNALVNTNGYPIIGICGMAGVGKTRMMEKAWEELKDKKIFDKVTRANVGGEELDVIKLQDQLYGHLNCHLEPSNNEVKRASQLKGGLMNGGKVLVILDDVWDRIPLKRIGIPFGDGSFKGCKILMTSRKDTVCRNNNCIDPIQIKPLTDGEAWEMFKTTVGTSKIESLDSSLAEKVCKECGALPLLIGAVGSALKHLTENFWKDALHQLENCKFQEIDGIDERVYNGLKFSFEKLAKGEKACLLLCSFFPEDADIDIKRLFEMATGSQLLESGRNIGGLVDSLKSSSLLLEGKNDDYVKVHDIIRDVARSIATRDPGNAFLSVRCRSWLPDNEEYPYPTRRLLHLNLEGESFGFPDDMVCPDLHTLWLQSDTCSQQLSSGFFNAFVNIKVLLLRGKFLFDDQLTIPNLEKLRVLILERCKISRTFISSVSRNLEILCINRCDLPSLVNLPELKNLRKLEILNYNGEIEIVEKAISRLSSLEELIVPNGFKSRDGDDDKSICWEISQLGCLRNLAISLIKLWQFPDRDIFSNLVEFSISVGPIANKLYLVERKKVRLERIHIERWWMPLVERAETVELGEVSGLPINGLSDSNMGEAFANLKELRFWFCHEMEHVGRWEKGRNQRLKCFTNLTSLYINYCKGLKYVFSYSVAKCLLQLQTLNVQECAEIEEIIRVEESTNDGDDDQQEIICFPNLQSLTLYYLPSLKRFCRKKVTFHNIRRLDIQNVDNTKSLLGEIERGSDHCLCSKLERLCLSSIQPQLLPSQMKLELQNLEKLLLNKCWWPGKSLFNGSLTFNTLKELEVYNNPEICTLFTTSVFTSLHQLRSLEIRECSLLEEIVEDEMDDSTPGVSEEMILLPLLTSITLERLPRLRSFSSSTTYTFNMPALRYINLYGCPYIERFTSLRITTPSDVRINGDNIHEMTG